MTKRLLGKTVFITGASGGLGEHIARLSAKNGANLILLARNRQKLEKLKEELETHFSVQVHIVEADVGNKEELAKALELVDKQTDRIDILVNNAGFGKFTSVMDTSLFDAENMFNVNVLGLIALTKWVLPKMTRQGKGHIINIASMAGKIATPKSAVYAATKSAVLAFSNSLRMEMKDAGIYVTTVNPGPMITNFFNVADESGNYLKNVGRWVLKPEYVAEKVVASMLTNKREINLPKLMEAGSRIYHLFPSIVERVGKKAFFKK